jgi:hypothetical protein
MIAIIDEQFDHGEGPAQCEPSAAAACLHGDHDMK